MSLSHRGKLEDDHPPVMPPVQFPVMEDYEYVNGDYDFDRDESLSEDSDEDSGAGDEEVWTPWKVKRKTGESVKQFRKRKAALEEHYRLRSLLSKEEANKLKRRSIKIGYHGDKKSEANSTSTSKSRRSVDVDLAAQKKGQRNLVNRLDRKIIAPTEQKLKEKLKAFKKQVAKAKKEEIKMDVTNEVADEMAWTEYFLYKLNLEYLRERNILCEEALEIELGPSVPVGKSPLLLALKKLRTSSRLGNNASTPDPAIEEIRNRWKNVINQEGYSEADIAITLRNPLKQIKVEPDTFDDDDHLENETLHSTGGYIDQLLNNGVPSPAKEMLPFDQKSDRRSSASTSSKADSEPDEPTLPISSATKAHTKGLTLHVGFLSARQKWICSKPSETEKRLKTDTERGFQTDRITTEKRAALDALIKELIQRRDSFSRESQLHRDIRIAAYYKSVTVRRDKDDQSQTGSRKRDGPLSLKGLTPEETKARVAAYSRLRNKMEKGEYELYLQLLTATGFSSRSSTEEKPLSKTFPKNPFVSGPISVSEFETILCTEDNIACIDHWANVKIRKVTQVEVSTYRKMLADFIATRRNSGLPNLEEDDEMKTALDMVMPSEEITLQDIGRFQDFVTKNGTSLMIYLTHKKFYSRGRDDQKGSRRETKEERSRRKKERRRERKRHKKLNAIFGENLSDKETLSGKKLKRRSRRKNKSKLVGEDGPPKLDQEVDTSNEDGDEVQPGNDTFSSLNTTTESIEDKLPLEQDEQSDADQTTIPEHVATEMPEEDDHVRRISSRRSSRTTSVHSQPKASPSNNTHVLKDVPMPTLDPQIPPASKLPKGNKITLDEDMEVILTEKIPKQSVSPTIKRSPGRPPGAKNKSPAKKPVRSKFITPDEIKRNFLSTHKKIKEAAKKTGANKKFRTRPGLKVTPANLADLISSKRMRSVKTFSCQNCPSLLFHKRNDLLQHLFGVHFDQSEPLQISCPFGHPLAPEGRGSSRLGCVRGTFDCDSFRKHLHENHPDEDEISWFMGAHTRKEIEDKTTFYCNRCTEVCSTFPELDKHFIEMHDNQRYCCPHCGIYLKRENHWRDHIVLMHPEAASTTPPSRLVPSKLFQCDDCHSEFSTQTCLSLHKIEGHTLLQSRSPRQKRQSTELYPCPTCDKKFTFKANMINHTRSCKDLAYECFFCKAQFDTEDAVISHVEKAHPDEEPVCAGNHKHPSLSREPYKCELCRQSYPQLSQLRMHFLDSHELDKYLKSKGLLDPMGKTFSVQSNSCTIGDSDYAAITSKSTVATKCGQSATLHTCQLCQQSYETKKFLHTHIDSDHKKDDVVNYGLCKTCNINFDSVVLLRIHNYELHTSDQVRYACPLCEKSVSRMGLLKRHLKKSHQGQKIDESEVKTIPSSRGRTNRPAIKHSCEICSLQFDTDLLLKSHEAMKHYPVRVKFCDFCGLQINPKRGLREHVDQFHPPKVAENVPEDVQAPPEPKPTLVQDNTKRSSEKMSLIEIVAMLQASGGRDDQIAKHVADRQNNNGAKKRKWSHRNLDDTSDEEKDVDTDTMTRHDGVNAEKVPKLVLKLKFPNKLRGQSRELTTSPTRLTRTSLKIMDHSICSEETELFISPTKSASSPSKSNRHRPAHLLFGKRRKTRRVKNKLPRSKSPIPLIELLATVRQPTIILERCDSPNIQKRQAPPQTPPPDEEQVADEIEQNGQVQVDGQAPTPPASPHPPEENHITRKSRGNLYS